MIEAVIFDLGNVLLHFDHRIIGRRFQERFPGAAMNPDIHDAFWTLAASFENGETDPAQFLGRWRELAGSDAAEQELADIWNNIFWVNEELLPVVEALASSKRLVLLSNTNALHVEFARDRFPEVFKWFSAQVLSFEQGCAKPSREIFEAAVREAQTSAGSILYFDDVNRYARAAAQLGIHAYTYISAAAVRDICTLHEIDLAA